jgi:hypothetical protein
MPIRNDYAPLLSANRGTAIQPVDWNKRSADSLSSLRVISAGRMMMNKMRPGKLVECSSNAAALLAIVSHSTFPYYCRLHPKMTGTVVVE